MKFKREITMNPFDDITKLTVTDLTSSQQALSDSLMELMLQKSINRISVSELTRTAHVARSTFYAYYENLDDLLVEIEDRLVHGLLVRDQKMTDHNLQDANDFTYFSEVIDFVNKNELYFYALLNDENFDHRFVTKWKTAIKYNLWSRVKLEMTDHNKFILEMAASITVDSIRFYTNSHVRPKKEEIYVIVAKTLKLFDL